MSGAVDLPLMPSYGRVLFWINAVLAWIAVSLQLTLNLSGYYVDRIDPAKATILGNTAAGVDTPLERFLDWATYFTVWSNVTVAVVLTVLAARPALFARRDRVGLLWRVLRLDSVVMIVITGVLYNLLLAEGGKTGWDAVSNTLVHVAVPLVTLVVWIVAGPRDLIRVPVMALSLVLPLIWAAFALVRGAAVGAYPYPFLDVSANGLASVLVFIVVIVIVAILLELVLWAVDAALSWTMGRAPATETAGD